MPFLTDRHNANNPAVDFEPSQFSEELTARLNDVIVGQHAAVDAVVRAAAIASARLGEADSPLVSMLFVGPTGVGKTELVRQLAASLRSDVEDFCRIDMNALSQEHYAASFNGAPPGYSGSREMTSLFNVDQVEGDLARPGIVLFDEIEKAHPVVIRALLHVLDTGVLRMATGAGRISFRNCIVVMTSNLGFNSSMESRDDESDPLQAIRDFFDPEFFNRIDEIVEFGPLTVDTIGTVATNELTRLARRLRARHVQLTWDPAAIGVLMNIGFDPRYGARELRRVLRREVVHPVAEEVLRAIPGRERPLHLHLTARDDASLAVRTE